MPANAGIQGQHRGTRPWTPACAACAGATIPFGNLRNAVLGLADIGDALTLLRLRPAPYFSRTHGGAIRRTVGVPPILVGL